MGKNTKKINNAEIEWFNNPNIITSFIIGLIALIVLLSQSFAIKNNLSPSSMLGSILNHNIMYLLVGIYFIALKTKIGKKYFDFLNIFLILLYLLSAITSLLTVFQSFGLASLLGAMIDVLIVINLFHTLLRSTKVWVSADLGKSPFNEITNNGYFSTILVLAITLLAVDLISSTSFDGTILSLLDTLYIGLFVRYVYLYGEYLNRKKIAVKNEGNFDEVRELISKTVDDFVEEHELDKKYEDIKDKVSEFSDNVEEKVDNIKDDIKEIVENSNFDEKLENAKEVVSNFTNDVKEEVKEMTDNFVIKSKEEVKERKTNVKKKISSKPKEEIKSRKKEKKTTKKVGK